MSELSRKIEAHLTGSEENVVFYDEKWTGIQNLHSDVLGIKRLLTEQGVRPGDKILLAKENSYIFIAIYLALIQFGATVVPVNPYMPKPELMKVGSRAQVTGAFVSKEIVDRMDSEQLNMLRFIVTIPAKVTGASELVVSPVGNVVHEITAEQEPSEEETAILLFTSGTTGLPKGVKLSHQQVLATVDQVIKTHLLGELDISYCFLPLFHINAQVVALLSTIISGGKLVVEEKFSASRFWNTVNQHQVTWVSAVPTVIGILIKGENTPEVPASLRFVRSASAPLPMLTGKRFESRFGVPIIESYGITEAASQVCVNPLPPGKRKAGSVGLPAGVNLKIVADDGSQASVGETGEIAIQGDSVIKHYAYGDEGKGSFQNGWFHTGDLGYVDEEGYVFITGRKKEMINRAGQKISPREVEDVISQHDEVKSVAVIGLPDELYGERVVAYLVPEPWVKDKEALVMALNELCRNSLSAYKCPEEFNFVETIPAGPTGKVQRHRLREEVLALGSR